MSLWHWDIRGHGTFDALAFFGTNHVNRHTHVLASICENSQPEGEPLDFPFMGAATMRIANIVPRDDGNVDLRIEVGWDNDLNLRILFAIFD